MRFGQRTLSGRSWKWTIPGLVIVALFAALANPPDQGVTSPADFEYVQRVVDGDTLMLGRLINPITGYGTNYPTATLRGQTPEK